MSYGGGGGEPPEPDAVLLDTDVFSNLLRGGERAAPWIPLLSGCYTLVSFVTAGELQAWAEIKNWGERRRDDLAKRLASTIIVPYDKQLISEYARVVADARKTGHALAGSAQVNDRWIAATARLLGVPLLTGNHRHFKGLPGLSLLGASPDPSATQEASTPEPSFEG